MYKKKEIKRILENGTVFMRDLKRYFDTKEFYINQLDNIDSSKHFYSWNTFLYIQD